MKFWLQERRENTVSDFQFILLENTYHYFPYKILQILKIMKKNTTVPIPI